MADAKLTALTGTSVPALDDLLYGVDVSDTTDDAAGSSRSVLHSRLLGLAGVLPGGRLTLTTGVSVTTSDVTAASTLYYTPHVSDYVRLYDGTRVKEYVFTERSLALSGLTDASNYDVWLYDNAGTLTLEPTIWTNGTTRATALAWQSGLGWVKSGTATRLYVGSFRTTSTTTTEDSGGGSTTQVGGKRFLWNAYNRVTRPIAVKDTTDSWTYGTDAFRALNGASGNKVEFILGIQGEPVYALELIRIFPASGGLASGGIGLDSTTVNSANVIVGAYSNSSVSPATAVYQGFPGLGYHYLQALERSRSGTNTFYGDDGATDVQGGLVAEVMA